MNENVYLYWRFKINEGMTDLYQLAKFLLQIALQQEIPTSLKK
jgi:hypothetical protein